VIRYQPFSRKRSYKSALILLLLAIFLSFSAFQDLFGVRSLLFSVIYPFEWGLAAIWKSTLSIPGSLSRIRNLMKENEELREKLKITAVNHLRLEELQKENERLRQILGFKSRSYLKLLPAEVIARESPPGFHLLIIDKGERAGVKKDQPVLVEEGLVGKVIEVFPFSAKVLLLVDASLAVAAVDQRTRAFGVAVGDNSFGLDLKYVPLTAEIQEGDRIVTSSLSYFAPPGIPVGTVTKVSKRQNEMFYQVKVKPLVDFNRLEEVFIAL